MSGGLDMTNESGVSSVVGVVLLLLLVVLAASVIGLTLSAATQNAVESTPNVQFILSADPQMLYHSGGDILYKDRLVFYSNGVDITNGIEIDSTNTWTEWRTGQAIELPAGYYVTNLTIIALDTLGRDQLLFRGSGVPVTPLPTVTTTTTPTVVPTTPTPTPTTPTPTITPTPTVTPTPTPTPSPYYEVGSDNGSGYVSAVDFVASLNNWSNALYGEDVVRLFNGNNLAFYGDVPIGNEPILISSDMVAGLNEDKLVLNTYGDSLSEVQFTRAPGYEGELLVISSAAELETTGATLKLDGMGHGAAPLLVITSGGSLDVNGYITLINNTNPTGNGGAIRNEGSLDVSTNMIIYNNTARNGGGVYNSGTSFSITKCDIYDNVASEKGGGIYNAGSNTVTINNGNAKVYNNSATDGGGVYNAGILSGGFPITHNTASGKGGGIYNTGTLAFSSGTQPVLDNSATYGGGVYNEGTMTTKGSISGNTASTSGGGVYNKGTYTFSWTSTTNSNEAQYGGGIYNTGTVPFYGGSISGNTATIQGGGLYNTYSFTLGGGSSITGNTAPLDPNRYG